MKNLWLVSAAFCSCLTAQTQVNWIIPPPTELYRDEVITVSWEVTDLMSDYEAMLLICPTDKGPDWTFKKGEQQGLMQSATPSGRYQQTFALASNTKSGKYYAIAYAIEKNGDCYKGQPVEMIYHASFYDDQSDDDNNTVVIVPLDENNLPYTEIIIPYNHHDHDESHSGHDDQ